MGHNDVTDCPSRDRILKLLWEDDIDRVGRGKVPVRLQKGEEFVDLQLLEKGVQRALEVIAPMGGVLARKAVEAHTWSRIVAQLRPSQQRGSLLAQASDAARSPQRGESALLPT